MNLAAKIEFLQRAIESQRTTLRLQTILAVVLFTVGVAVVILGLVRPGLILSESLKAGQTLGGALVTVSAFVPIFTSRRDKIAALRSLLVGYEQLKREGDANTGEGGKLDQYFDQYFARVLGG